MEREYRKRYPQGPDLPFSKNKMLDSNKDRGHDNIFWGLNFSDTITNIGRRILRQLKFDGDKYDEMSLASLLDPRSPYSDDFMPAYKVITLHSGAD